MFLEELGLDGKDKSLWMCDVVFLEELGLDIKDKSLWMFDAKKLLEKI